LKSDKSEGSDPQAMQRKITENALNIPCLRVGRNTSSIETLGHHLLHQHQSMWKNIVILAAHKEKGKNLG